MKLGRLEIKNKYILAPMALYTDIALRKICQDYGAGYSFSELTATAGFIRKTESFKRRIDFYDSELGLQFLSNSPEELKIAIEMVNNREFYEGLDRVKSIDLNLGCPSKNIMDQNLGSALLNQPNLVRELFKVMKKYSKVPISAKIRLGINSKHKKQSKPYLKIAQIAKEEGLDFITIHARTSGQGYEGEVDIEAIKEVSKAVNIPIVGNGNITDRKSANEMLKYCDAVMIGREAVKEPFIFKEFNDMSWKFNYREEKIICIKKYLKYAEKYNVGFQHIKIHMQSFLKGLKGQREMIMELTSTKNKNEIMNLLKKEFDI